jgi:hypothetical protein
MAYTRGKIIAVLVPHTSPLIMEEHTSAFNTVNLKGKTVPEIN